MLRHQMTALFIASNFDCRCPDVPLVRINMTPLQRILNGAGLNFSVSAETNFSKYKINIYIRNLIVHLSPMIIGSGLTWSILIGVDIYVRYYFDFDLVKFSNLR